MTTIKRTFIHPNDRSIDDKLAMLTGNYKPLKQEVLTEAQDKKKRDNKNTESKLQSALCKWLRLQYPDLYFQTDFAAGLYLPINIATIRASQAPEMKVLDVTILRARKPYHGLVIELKRDGESPYLKDGVTLKANEHTKSQHESIQLLKKEGYAACFAVGLDQAIEYIKKYMALPQW